MTEPLAFRICLDDNLIHVYQRRQVDDPGCFYLQALCDETHRRNHISAQPTGHHGMHIPCAVAMEHPEAPTAARSPGGRVSTSPGADPVALALGEATS